MAAPLAMEWILKRRTDEDSDSEYDFMVKFMLLGDSGVGKTCFLHRYIEGEFRSKFTATVGVDFRLKRLEYDFPEGEEGKHTKKKVNLQIWDTAGQERYRSLTKAFFRDGMGFILLYDVSNAESFQSVRAWLSELKNGAYCENPDIILVGNKKDLEHRAVSERQGKQLARELRIQYMETSALTGESVHESVHELLQMVVKKMQAYVKHAKNQEHGNSGDGKEDGEGFGITASRTTTHVTGDNGKENEVTSRSSCNC